MTQSPYGTPGSDPSSPGTNPSSTPQYPSAPPAWGETPSQYPPAPAYTPQAAYPATASYASGPTTGYSAPMPPTKQPKSAMMGIIGLVVVVVAAVIFFVLSVRLYTQLLEMLGPELAAGQVPSAGALSQQQIEQLSGPGAGMLGITVVGIVGLVLSIIATAQNKGRVFGIIGIVVGVIAPFSLFFAAGFAAAGM